MDVPIGYLIACFAGGTALVNGVPHLVHGVSGRAFPTPFASPPGEGLSPPLVNVLWGMANWALAEVLLGPVARLDLTVVGEAVATGAGMLAMGLFLAWHFGRQNGGKGPDRR